MAISPEAQAKVQLWREKAKRNELSLEEMKEAVIYLRQDRTAAAQSSAMSKAKKVPINSDSLLGELDNL